MTEATLAFDPEGFHAPAQSQRAFIKQYVPEDDDEGVIATFERVKEFKPFLSQQKGEDVYEDVDFIRIVIRGNDKLEVVRPATEADHRRFPFAWQQHQRGKEQSANGTGLDDLGIPGPMIAAYQAKNVFTVEDLAKVTDGNLQNLPAGARDFRHKARERMQLKQKAEGTDSTVAALVKQNQELMQQNTTLAAQLQRVLSKLDGEGDAGDQKKPAKKSA